jgi:tRNA(fMet)-specific endonuclease VapC
VVAAAELRFGAAKRRSSRLTTQLELILDQLTVAAFEPPADRVYADLRAGLETAGTPIGANDLWIAAQALHDQSVLVTDNVREFSRVPGLRFENWLRD